MQAITVHGRDAGSGGLTLTQLPRPHAAENDVVVRVHAAMRVNAVAPGPVWTPLIPATLPDTAEFGKQSPLGRPAQPAELAPAYVYLASREAGYVTAETLNVTGGTPLP